MRGETVRSTTDAIVDEISIHSPHARGDTSAKRFASIRCYFNPLPSCEGRPQQERPPPAGRQFQSTPLMRGETIVASTANWRSRISIHSPHARGDQDALSVFKFTLPISIHSPHARGDCGLRIRRRARHDFNPLPSCEGRRACAQIIDDIEQNFNPLPSCEGRPCANIARIKSHARFQSTPLMRGETLTVDIIIFCC